MDVALKIKELAESILKERSALQEQDPGHFIVDVVYNSRTRPEKLIVIVDGDNGVTIDVCADVSRKLSDLMEEQDLLTDAYTLDVSTPGLEHPLKLKRQYFKNKGRQFKAHLLDKTIVQGKLEDVSEQGIVIQQVISKKESKLIEVPFDQIEKGFVMVSFKHN